MAKGQTSGKRKVFVKSAGFGAASEKLEGEVGNTSPEANTESSPAVVTTVAPKPKATTGPEEKKAPAAARPKVSSAGPVGVTSGPKAVQELVEENMEMNEMLAEPVKSLMVPESLHHRLKIMTATEKTKINEWVVPLIDKALKRKGY